MIGEERGVYRIKPRCSFGGLPIVRLKTMAQLARCANPKASSSGTVNGLLLREDYNSEKTTIRSTKDSCSTFGNLSMPHATIGGSLISLHKSRISQN